MIRQPVSIYNNWSAYDELSDTIELDEKLALKQLDELLRLREIGVRFDYYLMDAFWFDPAGGYRTWRKPHWPDGPDKWLTKCHKNGVKPGLWVSSNHLCHIEPADKWADSLNASKTAMCMFSGGFLADFIDVLQHWCDRGVQAFKFDFIDFNAATPEVERTHLPEDIRQMNVAALKSALMVFREKNPDVLIQGYNGLGGDQGGTSGPFRKTVDPDWLTVFDSLYSGDARPSDVPAMCFWRSMDIYCDHMVRQYEANGVPLERIDNAAFMIGTTGTCYSRRTAAWQGMLILSLARGGWANVYYGNLELLDKEKGHWFAKAQRMFMTLQALGRTHTFGAIPGQSEPYGYASVGETGAVYAVVNPSQSIADVVLPRVNDWQVEPVDGRVLFTDAGFKPTLSDHTITLGPEQVAIVGFGSYAAEEFDLGVQEDVVIPASIRPMKVLFDSRSPKLASAELKVPAGVDLRIVMRQVDKNGQAVRTSGGFVQNGVSLGKIFRLSASQHGNPVPVHVNYDKAIWSGLSWAVGEIRGSDLIPRERLAITCETTEARDVAVECSLYAVSQK